MTTKYLHLRPSDPLPEINALRPFRSVVVIEEETDPERQHMVSRWLVDSGCLYMMAWGVNPSSWDDSVDLANMEAFDHGEIPDDRLVITTWHEDEPLEEVFRFAKINAIHPTVEIENALILQIGGRQREKELVSAYVRA